MSTEQFSQTEYLNELHFFEEILLKNSLLRSYVERARAGSSKVAVACPTDDPRSILAAEIINHIVGPGRVELINSSTLSENEKKDVTALLADTLRNNAQKKVTYLQRQVALLSNDPHPDVVKAKEKNEAELRKAEQYLSEDFSRIATEHITGEDGAIWQSFVMAFAGKNHLGGVVGGVDVNTSKVIRPFLRSNPAADPDQFYFSSYLETGPIRKRHFKHQFETIYKGEIIPNSVKIISDPAFNPKLTAERIAAIAHHQSNIFRRIVPVEYGEPISAFCTYSTGKSGAGENVELMRKAFSICRELFPDSVIGYGPTQWDAATSEIAFAAKKASMIADGATPEEIAEFEVLAPGATVFLLSDLHATNPLVKSRDEVWVDNVDMGPLFFVIMPDNSIQLFPASDLSRGASIESVAGTILAVLVMAEENMHKEENNYCR